MSECDSYDELFVQACEAVSTVDESDLDLPPSQMERRWETIVKLTQRCKTLRGAAEKNWTAGMLYDSFQCIILSTRSAELARM